MTITYLMLPLWVNFQCKSISIRLFLPFLVAVKVPDGFIQLRLQHGISDMTFQAFSLEQYNNNSYLLYKPAAAILNAIIYSHGLDKAFLMYVLWSTVHLLYSAVC